MLTLDEAITHAKEVAKANRDKAEGYSRGEEYEQIKANECVACAEEHEQLASWLEELETLRVARPKGKWLYPYADIKINGRRVGKSDKECSVCHVGFSNNLPWNANFCPYCGADMRGGENK